LTAFLARGLQRALSSVELQKGRVDVLNIREKDIPEREGGRERERERENERGELC
jgi:hypothetical protein